MDPHREVELKLEVSPADLRRLPRHPLVQALAQGPAVSRRLDSVYFDTPGHDLAAAGFALRIRRCGGERVQTVKGERSSSAGLSERLEVEGPIAGERPDLALISEPELRARVVELVGDRPLEPVFRTEFRRTRRVLRDGDTEWSLDADEGSILTGDGREPLCELELELRAGEPVGLFGFALRLQEQFDLLPATRSKAERGYALARGESARPFAERRVELAPDARLEEALEAILGQCLAQITQSAACALEGRDAEGVHQMRIGVRRLRAALSAFAPLLPGEPTRVLRSELRWLGSELGAARDVDVFHGEVLASLAPQRVHDPAFKRLVEEAAGLRTECADRVRESVRSPRYARLVLELGAWIAGRQWRLQQLDERSARLFGPAGDYAHALLDRRQRKLRRAARRLDESDDARHAVRLQLKKLRYTGEFFRPLYRGRGAKRFLRRAARLQNALGTLNDVATAARILESLLARLGAERAPAHDRAAGFVEGWIAQLSRRELEAADERWRRIEGTRPFWK